MVEAQDGFHQRFFATRTEHFGSPAADMPDQCNDAALQLQDDLRDGHGFAAAGENTVVPDAHKAFGQDVQGEAANEFHGLQVHHLVGTAIAVVLVPEADALFAYREQSVVTDGDFVGVATQIIDHRFGPGKGPLGVHHPGLCKETAEELRVFTGEGTVKASPFQPHSNI